MSNSSPRIPISVSDLLVLDTLMLEAQSPAIESIVEPQPHERPDISQHIRQQNADSERVGLDFHERPDISQHIRQQNADSERVGQDFHERSDISQHIRQQNADTKRVRLDLGESSGVKRRKRRSQVWEHFEMLYDANGKDRARCKHCNQDYDADSRSGTSRLSNHLKSKSCRGKRNGGGGGDNLAGNLSDMIAIKEKSVMDQPLNHLDVARMIIKQGDASRVDSTNKAYIIELYKEEKEKLCSYFKKCSCRLCVTVCRDDSEDDWYSYLAVVFIDDDWKLKSKILKYFKADEINDMTDIKNMLLEWGIENNLSSMIIDDVDCNLYKGDDWFSNQGSLLFNNKLPCCKVFLPDFVHFLNDYLYGSLKRLVKNARETSSENENFRNGPTNEELHKFWARVAYSKLMGVLKNVLGLKEAGFELANVDPHFKTLTKEEWDVLRLMYEYYEEWDFPNHFYKSYDTANTFFPQLCSIHKCVKELRKCHTDLFSDHGFVDSMERVWCEYNLILAVASVLDPRFKMDIVENWYKEIFGDEWKKEFANFKNSFTDIYSVYAREIDNFKSCTPGSEETNSSISYKMLDPLGKPRKKSSYEPNHVQLLKSDLDRYLEEDKFPPLEDFKILEWWRDHARHFPTLARMARDFLSIQVVVLTVLSDGQKNHLKKLDKAEVSDDEADCSEKLGIIEAYLCTESWLAT